MNIIESLDPRQTKKNIIDDEHTIYLRISQILVAISILAVVLMIALRVNLFFIPPVAATLGIIFAFIDILKTHKYRALEIALFNGFILVAWIVSLIMFSKM